MHYNQNGFFDNHKMDVHFNLVNQSQTLLKNYQKYHSLGKVTYLPSLKHRCLSTLFV